ncbi:hypothetical protein B0O99DRAFT_680953 [Bisporella sp. PMI_857]|nr:hypothetical protein B0O99DRAFT_680953 [Bisporella sp. PMI_857]
MKPISAICTAVGLAAVSLAQDITSLPQCAQDPILQAITNSGCPLTDISCICGNKKFIDGLLAKIPTVCNADEVAVTAQFATELCIGYGVTLSLTVTGITTVSAAVAPTSVPAASNATTTSSSSVESTSSATSVAPTAATTTPSAGMINMVDSNFLVALALLGVAAILLCRG